MSGYNASTTQIDFGPGKAAELGEWVERIGCRRALSSRRRPPQTDVERLKDMLDDRAAAIFAGVVMHTPAELTQRAMEMVRQTAPDCVVTFDGGSTIR